MNVYDRLGTTKEDVDRILAAAQKLQDRGRTYLRKANRNPQDDAALNRSLAETETDLRAFLKRIEDAQREARQDEYREPYELITLQEDFNEAVNAFGENFTEQLDRLNKYHYRSAKESEVPENIRVIAEAATEIAGELLYTPIELNLILPCEKHEADFGRPWDIAGCQDASTNVIDVRADREWHKMLSSILHEARHVWQTEVHGKEERRENYKRMEADAERYALEKFPVVRDKLRYEYGLGRYFDQS